MIPQPAIVLGAGASHGAKVASRRTPPLDGNFLPEAERIFSRLHRDGANRAQVEAWQDFKHHLSQAGLKFSEVREWRLEELSTFLEARANLKGLQLYQGRPREHAIALASLKRVVAQVLLASGGQEVCSLHRLLIRSTKPSAVISFNYDLIADQTMLDLGVLDWRAAAYRGAKCAMIPTKTGGQRTFRIPNSRRQGALPLFKLHGSIHFQAAGRGKGFRLSGARLPKQKGELFDMVEIPDHPYLVPPIAAKIDVQQGTLKSRWYSAVDSLYKAKSWLIWGYSFPATDTISQVLFRTALARNRRNKPVFVINPDQSVARRIRKICKKVSVKQFTSIEEFLHEFGVLVPNR
jgi:hypothetical protein